MSAEFGMDLTISGHYTVVQQQLRYFCCITLRKLTLSRHLPNRAAMRRTQAEFRLGVLFSPRQTSRCLLDKR